VNPPDRLPLCSLELVTVTVAAPALPAGVVAVMVVLFTTVTPVAAVPPKVTAAPLAKSIPVMVTAVPPATGPPFGDTLVTNGTVLAVAAWNVTVCITQFPDAFRGAQE
jgi:hypothetical protein